MNAFCFIKFLVLFNSGGGEGVAEGCGGAPFSFSVFLRFFAFLYKFEKMC